MKVRREVFKVRIQENTIIKVVSIRNMEYLCEKRTKNPSGVGRRVKICQTIKIKYCQRKLLYYSFL